MYFIVTPNYNSNSELVWILEEIIYYKYVFCSLKTDKYIIELIIMH